LRAGGNRSLNIHLIKAKIMKKTTFSDLKEGLYVLLALVIFLFSKIKICAENGAAFAVMFTTINVIIYFTHLKGENWEKKKNLFKFLAIIVAVMPFFFLISVSIPEGFLIFILFVVTVLFVVSEGFHNTIDNL
jgi:hypothetical protein